MRQNLFGILFLLNLLGSVNVCGMEESGSNKKEEERPGAITYTVESLNEDYYCLRLRPNYDSFHTDAHLFQGSPLDIAQLLQPRLSQELSLSFIDDPSGSGSQCYRVPTIKKLISFLKRCNRLDRFSFCNGIISNLDYLTLISQGQHPLSLPDSQVHRGQFLDWSHDFNVHFPLQFLLSQRDISILSTRVSVFLKFLLKLKETSDNEQEQWISALINVVTASIDTQHALTKIALIRHYNKKAKLVYRPIIALIFGMTPESLKTNKNQGFTQKSIFLFNIQFYMDMLGMKTIHKFDKNLIQEIRAAAENFAEELDDEIELISAEEVEHFQDNFLQSLSDERRSLEAHFYRIPSVTIEEAIDIQSRYAQSFPISSQPFSNAFILPHELEEFRRAEMQSFFGDQELAIRELERRMDAFELNEQRTARSFRFEDQAFSREFMMYFDAAAGVIVRMATAVQLPRTFATMTSLLLLRASLTQQSQN